ncbi:MAG: hypothetical protein KBG38_07205 [Candidatus Cloacimonas sp.]|jgi:hypothetical protein|nr:hypothetical protein [Candidatus Cloacimonas sp.]
MITKDFADQLIAIEKKIFEGKELFDIYAFNLANIKERINMVSIPDAEYEFFLEIKRSKKFLLKLTLHFQNTDGQLPLLRIDYSGTHKNPEIANKFVPKRFLQYSGQIFEADIPHIHYFVQTYGLDWAIPLSDDDFPVKKINSNEDIKNSILSISKLVNLQSNLTITYQDEVF